MDYFLLKSLMDDQKCNRFIKISLYKPEILNHNNAALFAWEN